MMAAIALLAALPVLSAQPPGRGGNRVDFLAGYLSLTDSQKEQAKTIFDAADTASKTLQGQFSSARTALSDAVKAGKPDADLDSLAAATGVIQGQLAAVQAKAQARFYALLTADQKAKYDNMRGRGGPGGSPGGGPGGGPGRRSNR